VDTLHSERFQDQTPRQVYAELLDEGSYLASPSTMYRILAARGESQERRAQRAARSYAVPRLEAIAPNQVWTWNITKLATLHIGREFLNLYLVLDLFSRWYANQHRHSGLALFTPGSPSSSTGCSLAGSPSSPQRGRPPSTPLTTLIPSASCTTALAYAYRPRRSLSTPSTPVRHSRPPPTS
jgi:hypothetical protein